VTALPRPAGGHFRNSQRPATLEATPAFANTPNFPSTEEDNQAAVFKLETQQL
jgi:hypothetical protein